MQLNPARGRKLTLYALHTQLIPLWFMQLNPARGRKPRHRRLSSIYGALGLCSSTPRGDGNSTRKTVHSYLASSWFMQLNLARGRKLVELVYYRSTKLPVYAAQPREGTETPRTRFPLSPSLWFMQLNPARGRKPYRS